MKIHLQHPWKRGGIADDQNILGTISFELHQDDKVQTFRAIHVEPVNGRNMEEVRYRCKIDLIRQKLPELVLELKECVCRGVFFPQDSKKSQSLAKDFSIE